MVEKIKLFDNKVECCGCGACYNACPKHAISMKTDLYGFVYPDIDETVCIKCELCIRSCLFNNNECSVVDKKVWVAVAKDHKLLSHSASGAVFATLATAVLAKDGVVFGCAMEKTKESLVVQHIKVDIIADLHKLQGSKYVQSDIGNIFKEAKIELEAGKYVLFSGTPCQISGLKGFLRNKNYDKLLTVDIICHGVPSAKFFQGYIGLLEKQLRAEVVNFYFRDKEKGWGLNAKLEYSKNGRRLSKMIPSGMSSYYKLFLESKIYRENCYTCPYASSNRPAELSIGDYWGIEIEHPDYLANKGGLINEKRGVSCLIVNTHKGKRILEDLCEGLVLLPSTFEKASHGNTQLRHPSLLSFQRKEILAQFEVGGYEAVEKWYIRSLGMKYYLRVIWSKTPDSVKKFINRIRKYWCRKPCE